MPDHPSWPAELVEKEPWTTANDGRDSLRIVLADDTSRARQALRATMDERDEARSQADALAEALEELCGWIDEAVEACDINTAAEARNTARCRLASIRKTAAGENAPGFRDAPCQPGAARPYDPQRYSAAARDAEATTTCLLVRDVDLFGSGDVVRVTRTGEMFWVVVGNAVALTVYRGAADTQALPIRAGDELVIVGNAPHA